MEQGTPLPTVAAGRGAAEQYTPPSLAPQQREEYNQPAFALAEPVGNASFSSSRCDTVAVAKGKRNQIRLAVPPPKPPPVEALDQHAKGDVAPPITPGAAQDDAAPAAKKVKRARKVGGLRWWCGCCLISTLLVVFASMLGSGTGFQAAGNYVSDCWNFVVNEFHDQCFPPLRPVTTRERCELANVFITGNNDIAVKMEDETHHADTPACYEIYGTITWDLYDNASVAAKEYYPVCQGSKIRQTDLCQEGWKNRINSIGWLLVVSTVCTACCACVYTLTCVVPKIRSACGWASRIGGTDTEDLINQPRDMIAG